MLPAVAVPRAFWQPVARLRVCSTSGATGKPGRQQAGCCHGYRGGAQVTREPINLHPVYQHLLSKRLTSLGIMGKPRVPPLNPSETIVLSEHYRL